MEVSVDKQLKAILKRSTVLLLTLYCTHVGKTTTEHLSKQFSVHTNDVYDDQSFVNSASDHTISMGLIVTT